MRTYTCSYDGSTYTEAIPALGHEWGNWKPDGKHLTHTRTCSRGCTEAKNCEYTVTTTNDRDTYTCPVCGDTYEVKKDSAVRIGTTGYANLDTALAAEGENYTIVLLKDLDVAAQINVTKSVTIEGAGHTIKANNTNGWATNDSIKHLLNIQGTSNVTVQNLTLDSNNQACGNQAFNATGVTFTNVTMKKSPNAGLLVNRSTVIANNLTTSDNAWGGVNVDGGTPHFTLTGNSTLNEDNKIWAEKANGPAVVTADGYYCHLIKDEKNREFYAWSTSVSDTAAAKVKVGGVDVYYTSLSNAITNAKKDESTTISLTANAEVTLDNGVANEGDKSRNVTFVGDGTQKVDVITKATDAEGGMLSYQRGSTFTFENVTIQAGEGNFDGIVCDELVYNNCIIKGKLTLYGKATFINCTFENTMADQYSIWTWGGTDVKFEKCTFNTNGKAILLYGQATAKKPTNLTVSNCTFNDRNNGSAGKAAIEIGNDYNATYSLTVTNATVNGFADGKNTGSKIWANKDGMDDAHLSITIDGMKQRTVKVNSYETLKAAISALGNNSLTLDIDGDITVPEGEPWTPISVDGSQGNGTLTINGNGHKIVGLNAPLVANTWAGKSNCIIKGLTLENANIVVDENDANGNVGVGAFIGQPCASQIITLESCNLVNSTVKGGHWAGGLIGVSGGYNGTDGPVFENVTIKNCSVTGSTIESKGSVGAIIGHAAWDSATRVDITGCTVTGNTVKSTGSSNDKAGSLMGTVGCAGSNQVNSDLEPHAEPGVFVTNCTVNDNNVTSNTTTITEVYGRQGSTGGKLVVDGVTKCQ